MEKLSTEALLGIKQRIEEILKERNEEDNWIPLDENPLTWEERRKLYLNKFNALIEEFTTMLPKFIEYKKQWLTSDTVTEYGGYVKNTVKDFCIIEWNNLLKQLESNKIFRTSILSIV